MKKVGKEPLISVIVPVFNVEDYVGKCLDSIINQTYKNLEIIVINDGSNDGSGKICNNYAKKDERIKVIHQKNGGLSNARNTGINIAKGEYLAFIDSDDWVDGVYLQTLYHDIRQHQCDIAMVKHIIEYQRARIDTSSSSEYELEPEVCLSKMLYDDDVDISAWGKLYASKLFKSIRFPDGKCYEDSATTYKLIMGSTKIYMHSLPLYHYNKTNSSSITNNFDEKTLNLINETKTMTKDIAQQFPNLQKACERRLMWAHLSVLTKIATCKKANKEHIAKIINYIKKNSTQVLSNPYIPRRDKVGIKLACHGYLTFKYCWKIYNSTRSK